MTILIITLALLIGSFLNVCIYRIPKGESIAFPASHCMSCGKNLKAIDLVPVLSYVFNKGKCRYCSSKISLQYPIVESLNAIVYFMLFNKYGLTFTFVEYAVLSSLLIVISFIDYQYQIIPDGLVTFGLILGVVSAVLKINNIHLLSGIVGFMVGGGLFLLIALVSKGAMGGGDIKLMAIIGFILGWKYTLMVSLLSFIIGAILSITLMILKIKGRKDYIPFGPFIAIATYITILYSEEILDWYIKLII